MDDKNNEKLSQIKKQLEEITNKENSIDESQDNSRKIVKESKKKQLLRANEQMVQ